MKKLKMLKKTHFPTKAITQYFQKYVRYGSDIFWGSKDIPWAHFEAINKSPTHQMISPSTFSQQVHILPFLELFSPICLGQTKH